MLSIDIDNEAMFEAMTLLENMPGALKKATSTAIKKSINKAKNDATKKIQEKYTLLPQYIIRALKRITYVETLRAVLQARGRANDLAYFYHTPANVPEHRPPKGRYLFSQVIKGEGGHIPHAFLARMKSGHIGVFQRTSNESLPIEKKCGPSVPSMLGSPTIINYVADNATKNVNIFLKKEVEKFLMGYRK